MRKKASRFGLRRTSARIAWAAGQVSAHHCEPKRGSSPAGKRRRTRSAACSVAETISARCWVLWSKTCQKRQRSERQPPVTQLSSSDSMNSRPAFSAKEALEARHRPAGQAGARQEDRVVGRLALGLGLGERVERRLDEAEAAPAAGDALARRGRSAARPATAARERREGGRASARASKWISARASEAAATRVRASSAASAGRSWARITKRSFIGGRRLPSDIGYRALPGKSGRPAGVADASRGRNAARAGLPPAGRSWSRVPRPQRQDAPPCPTTS